MVWKKIRPPIDTIMPYIKESIGEGKDVKIAVTGYSMYPLLRSGTDKVVLSPPDFLSNLDVVLYRRKNGQYVLHRILHKKGDVLTIAGDNETRLEHPVYVSDCIAKMTAFVRGDKLYTVNMPFYKLYSSFWRLIFPLRRPVVCILRIAARCRFHLKHSGR